MAKPGIRESVLDNHLKHWKKVKKNSVTALYLSLLDHAKNRGGMKNFIGDIGSLSRMLFGFDPVKIVRKYPSWAHVFDEILRRKIEVPGRMERDNPRNSWVVYTKAIVSGARFMSSFGNAEQFHKFVRSFYVNEHSRLALPLLLEKEIFGFGFALSCDFLKENGYP